MLRKIIKIVTLVHLCIVLVAILIVGIWCACNWSWIVDQFTMDHHGVSIEMGNRREQMRQYLLDQGYEPENLCLTAEEYRQLNLEESDLIVLYELLGYEECKKVLQAWGYESWPDYLSENGFDDVSHWANAMYKRIDQIIKSRRSA